MCPQKGKQYIHSLKWEQTYEREQEYQTDFAPPWEGKCVGAGVLNPQH